MLRSGADEASAAEASAGVMHMKARCRLGCDLPIGVVAGREFDIASGAAALRVDVLNPHVRELDAALNNSEVVACRPGVNLLRSAIRTTVGWRLFASKELLILVPELSGAVAVWITIIGGCGELHAAVLGHEAVLTRPSLDLRGRSLWAYALVVCL